MNIALNPTLASALLVPWQTHRRFCYPKAECPPVSALLTYQSIKRKADKIEDISDVNERLEHAIDNYNQRKRGSRAFYLPNTITKSYAKAERSN
jgi:hypothetical protein